MERNMSNTGTFEPRRLGKTGLTVGRLGVSGGYGAPAKAFEMAFERGCNYFYHGSFRRKGMNEAVKNLCANGKRDEMVILAQIYTRWGWQFRRSFEKFLIKTGLEYADVLLLGLYNSEPSEKILDICAGLKEKGLVRFIAISGHNRKAFPKYAKKELADILHIRYNAVNRGAETEVFPHLPEERPGIVAFTATSHKKLLKPRNMPRGEQTPRASDCYRFVLSNPSVDVVITGPADMKQMEEALLTLERGPLSVEEMDWMRRVGDYIHR